MISIDTYPFRGGFWNSRRRKFGAHRWPALSCGALLAHLLMLADPTASALPEGDSSAAHEIRDKAYSFTLQFQYDSSRAYYRQAGELYREAGDTLQYHYCLNGIAESDIRLGDYHASLPVLEEALTLALERSGRRDLQSAQTFYLLGYVYAYLDSIELAYANLLQSIRIREEKLGENDPLTAASYYLMGTTSKKAGSYSSAHDYLQKALDIYVASHGPHSLETAITILAIGAVHDATGEYAASVSRYRAALTTLQASNRGHHTTAAACHFSLASALANLGDFQDAIRHYSLAAELYQDLYGEIHTTVAFCHARLGEIYTAAGDYEYAGELLTRALQILLRENTESHSGTAELYRMIGVLYMEMGELDEARTYCQKALSVHQSSLGEEHPQMWQFHAELARVLARRGEYDSSLLHFRRALGIRGGSAGEIPPLDNARIWLGTADVYRRMGHLNEAEAASQRALSIQTGHPDGNPLLWAEAHRSLGDISRTRSQFGQALQHYQEALIALSPGFSDTALHTHPQALEVTHGRETISLLTAKAAVLQKWNDKTGSDLLYLDAAVDHYQSAARLLARLQRTYRDDRSKLLLADAHHTLYGAAVELCADLYSMTGHDRYKQLGFSFAEQGKAGILLDHITRARSKESAGIPDSLLRLERDLTRELRFCETKILKLAETDRADGHILSHLRSRMVSLRQKREDLDIICASEYPSYGAWQQRARVADLAELMESIDPASCLLEYVAGSDRLYCFLLTRDTLRCIPLAGREGCEKSATGFRRALQTMNKRLYLSTAPELYGMLVKPLERYIDTRRHLIIVPDGFLHYVPFEALLRQDAPTETGPAARADFTRLPYLVRSHDISYAFSASFAIAAARGTEDPEGKVPSFAGFAPVFEDNTVTNPLPQENGLSEGPQVSSLRSITVDGTTFSELRSSEQEVSAIIEGFQEMGYEGKGYFHSAATEENFKLKAGEYPYVHVATHGFLNDQIPELSALLFADAMPPGREEDGVLYASEIMDLRLNASLVVLSSCQSGIGRVVRGEGIMAMTRAFALAGAQNIVCSLWKVYDSHSSTMMQNFYRGILAHSSYSRALQEAKLQMIRNPVTAFPMKWAAFVLIGTPLHPPTYTRLTRAGPTR